MNLPGSLPFILRTQAKRLTIATKKTCFAHTAILSASATFATRLKNKLFYTWACLRVRDSTGTVRWCTKYSPRESIQGTQRGGNALNEEHSVFLIWITPSKKRPSTISVWMQATTIKEDHPGVTLLCYLATLAWHDLITFYDIWLHIVDPKCLVVDSRL